MRKILVVMFLIIGFTVSAMAKDEVFKHGIKHLDFKIMVKLPNGKVHVHVFRTWRDDIYLNGDKNVTTSVTHQDELSEGDCTRAELKNLNKLHKKFGWVK